MSDKEKNIVYTAGDIEQYLAGNLLPMQMHAMEKAALDDPFLAEAIEGYQGMKDTEWNNQLVAVRDQIAEKGNVAKPAVYDYEDWVSVISLYTRGLTGKQPKEI